MDPPPPAELLDRLWSLPAAQALLKRLGDAPGVYIVGGAVRDLILGRAPRELDLVVEGGAEEVAARLGGVVRVHRRFGTATATRDGLTFDIAQSRRERYPHPGALPEVSPGPLQEDLLRRDFTVNAMAIAVAGERAGELLSAPQALADLENGMLRVLHDGSFVDDPTRLLRMVRYASRLRFGVERRTERLAASAREGGALNTVSGARIGAELRLLARESDPVLALEALHRHRLDVAIDPSLGQRDPALSRDALALLGDRGRGDLLALGLAMQGVPASHLGTLLDRLGFSAGERKVIDAVARGAERMATALARASRPSQIASAAGSGPPELVAAAGALGPTPQAEQWLSQIREVRLQITGKDLLAAGVQPGPAVATGLRAALAAKLDGRAGGAEAELAEALRAVSFSA